jgi:hypothetical protein
MLLHTAVPDRTVVFFKALDVEGQAPFDRLVAVDDVNDLDADRWVVSYGGILMGVLVDEKGTDKAPTRLRFIRIRDTTPYVLDQKRQLALFPLDEGNQWAEFTHVVMWPDGFLGARSSRDAPVIKWLSQYFSATSGEHCQIVNIYAIDVVDQVKELAKAGGLTKVTSKIHTSEAEQLMKDDKLSHFQSFWAAGKDTEAITIEVTISVDRTKKKLAKEVAEEAIRLASFDDMVDRLIISGRDAAGATQTVNLKEQRITQPIGWSDGDSNKQAYDAIIAARVSAENPNTGGVNFTKAALGN